MDNIAKYPKDWYEDIVRKTKPKKKGAPLQKSNTDDAIKKSNEHLPSINQDRISSC